MSAPSSTEVKRAITKLGLAVANAKSPESFQAFLIGGIIGNIVGNLSDDYWSGCVKVQPCGQPGCNCHEIAAKLMPVLDALRTDFRRHLQSLENN